MTWRPNRRPEQIVAGNGEIQSRLSSHQETHELTLKYWRGQKSEICRGERGDRCTADTFFLLWVLTDLQEPPVGDD